MSEDMTIRRNPNLDHSPDQDCPGRIRNFNTFNDARFFMSEPGYIANERFENLWTVATEEHRRRFHMTNRDDE